MKKTLLITSILTGISLSTYCQVFYVTPSEKKFESKIIDKLKYEGVKLTEDKLQSDYTVDCLLDGQYNAWKLGAMFHGYVKISDSKSGEEIARTKEVGKSPSAYNGFQAGPKIMSVIADKYLMKAIALVKSK
ncbi:hypothetical protein [Dyadobacter sp. LHD-138]|uniref:hypothetical protein n=1 Tax=Dyadobacter sp. LHD-138 TaxID=3071413 RepID=UPI0027E06706|nr:hypothetical protein [Dyadobacter sp. LHD-138]MDQ6477846.1 hypothetical protein [Dyadobacter sp. LHD-138]